MSYNVFAAPLRLELKPSHWLRCWKLLVHGGVALSLPLLPSPPLILLVAAVLIANLFRTPPPCPSVVLWHSTGQWDLDMDGRRLSAELAHPACVLTWMVIMPLRCRDRRRLRYIVVLPDMLSAASFRRLRARLRMAGSTPAEPGTGDAADI